jgi:hypothetical protein
LDNGKKTKDEEKETRRDEATVSEPDTERETEKDEEERRQLAQN